MMVVPHKNPKISRFPRVLAPSVLKIARRTRKKGGLLTA
jgi:hypothetical protein